MDVRLKRAYEPPSPTDGYPRADRPVMATRRQSQSRAARRVGARARTSRGEARGRARAPFLISEAEAYALGVEHRLRHLSGTAPLSHVSGCFAKDAVSGP
jgi:hypothetical protein